MSESNGTSPVKLTITHHRLPQHTHEAFIDWIIKEHLPLAIPVFKKYGVIDYSLVRIFPGNLVTWKSPWHLMPLSLGTVIIKLVNSSLHHRLSMRNWSKKLEVLDQPGILPNLTVLLNISFPARGLSRRWCRIQNGSLLCKTKINGLIYQRPWCLLGTLLHTFSKGNL